MVAFGHTAIGTMIGLGTAAALPDNAWPIGVAVAFVAGLISHYLTDLIPHGHYISEVKNLSRRAWMLVFLDVVVAFAAIIALVLWQFGISKELLLVLVGIAGAQAPDVFDFLREHSLIPETPAVKAHNHFHWQSVHWHTVDGVPRAWSWTDIWQVAVFAGAVIMVLGFSP